MKNKIDPRLLGYRNTAKRAHHVLKDEVLSNGEILQSWLNRWERDPRLDMRQQEVVQSYRSALTEISEAYQNKEPMTDEMFKKFTNSLGFIGGLSSGHTERQLELLREANFFADLGMVYGLGIEICDKKEREDEAISRQSEGYRR